MRICLVFGEHSPQGGIGHAVRRLAEVLEAEHEVVLIEAEGLEPSPRLRGLSFADDDHLRAAAVFEAIAQRYGSEGPDYLEVSDYRASGLVALQARRAGHQLLRRTTIGVRLDGSAELVALHDGSFSDPAEQRVAELEREQFRLADRLLWPGGDVLDLYRRHYGGPALPSAVRVGRAFPVQKPEPPPGSKPGEPLRILYVGRLQRLKGVLDLVEACLGLPSDDWELTLIGADTETAPMRQSARMTIEAMAGGDPRVRLEDALPHVELQRRWAEHDLLVVPSTFEVCANVALEAMRAGLPVLATPVGGQTELIEDGRSGWLTVDTGTGPIRQALAHLLDDRGEVVRVQSSGEVYRRFLDFTDPALTLTAYREALASPPASAGTRRKAPKQPAVTAVVPYYRAHPYVAEAVASLLDQSHRNLDVVLVNDGSFAPEDAVLDELAGEPRVQLAHQLNSGDSSARNLGLALARGDFLLAFDADNLLEPEFVARALEMLRAEPELAYVTCWLRFIDEDGGARPGGYAPLGNRVLGGDEQNWDGDTIALFPRRALDRLAPPYDPRTVIHCDWQLYRRLRARGEYGAVIPEPLARYRVLPGSMLRSSSEELHRMSWGEARTWRTLEAAE